VAENPVILVIARLSISSSYGQDVERPADDAFDTVQFYLPSERDAVYRIRTFALDHDIHVHRISWTSDQPTDFIQAHLDRTYGDVLAGVETVELTQLSTQDLVAAGFTSGELETVGDGGYRFWNPDGGDYTTRSEPAGSGEREGMSEVLYLGGIARFWLPSTWSIEMSAEHGGQSPHRTATACCG
jgi:hypothetical protein